MSSYVQKVLLPDEQVVFAAYLHWIVYIQGLFITVLGAIFSWYSPFMVAHMFGVENTQKIGHVMAGISFLIVVCGVALLLGAYIRQASTELVLTNRRIIAKYGFVSRATFEIMISRITGANFDQTIMGRILGYGTILVHGAGGEISPIDLVADPQDFHRALVQVIGQNSGQQR